ncbi:FG-GAP repeat protein [Candidatus Nomurabacteria bacterium]|nr:FG-GAP repeat protein [Candidatus Nomurabacteria bacterium]MCB9827688.1 FG-GAP repeat protein [Candidatus Nomurabacteria bacterium]
MQKNAKVLSIIISVTLIFNFFLQPMAAFEQNTSLADSDASFAANVLGDNVGNALSSAGDVNGDGYDDFLLGVRYGGDIEAGAVYLILGKAEGWAMGADIDDADASFEGEEAYDNAGYSIAGAGDVNNDGYDDFLIGAPDADSGLGKTYLILGKEEGWAMETSLADADASFVGEYESDYSGSSVSGAGDVNNDGYDDFLIGVSDADSGIGKTYLILGKEEGWAMETSLADADASFVGEYESDYSGFSVSGAGDVNNDGYDDFLIGAPDADSETGETYLILGKDEGWAAETSLADADASFVGEYESDYSGFSVSGAGDVNNDGYDDFLIGAPDADSETGEIYLILGKEGSWAMETSLADADASFEGEEAYDSAGYSIAGAGDVNDDGYDDFLLGSPWYNETEDAYEGKSYLILGKEGGWAMETSLADADASFIGEYIYDYSGQAVSGAGDVNGDGADDILIGAPGDGEDENLYGRVYLLLGTPSEEDPSEDIITNDNNNPTPKNTFKKDAKCRWQDPNELTWVLLEPMDKNGVSGINLTWVQYGADKINIKIDDGTGSYPWNITEISNDGQEFLPNVFAWQNIKVQAVNHCNKGKWSQEFSYTSYPEGWYNVK